MKIKLNDCLPELEQIVEETKQDINSYSQLYKNILDETKDEFEVWKNQDDDLNEYQEKIQKIKLENN